MKKNNQRQSQRAGEGNGLLIKRVLERKALVQQGKIDVSHAEATTHQAWKDLCLGLGLSLKDFSTCRSFVDVCVSKWPHVTASLTEMIMTDLETASSNRDARVFSRVLLAALDCESTKRCVKQVMSAEQGKDEGRIMFLLKAIQDVLALLETKLYDETQEVTKEFLEVQRDAERCFDCVGRVVSFVFSRSPSIDEVLLRIKSSTERIILRMGTQSDIHLLRSASLSLHHVNSTFQAPLSLRSILFKGPLCVGVHSDNTMLPPVTRSALLLGALSCAANNLEVDSETMLADLLTTIESCLSVASKDDEETVESSAEEQEDEERFEKITLACEALCAWSTKVKSCMNCTAQLISRAIQLVIVYMDHRESSVGTVCATAFERLIEASLRVNGGEAVLSQVFVEQMGHVNTPDFASARRGLYPMMEKLVQVLGAKRVSELQPGFVSTVMNSAFRVDEVTSNRPELGNGICNLIVSFFRSWMSELGFKVSKELKAELEIVANVLKRGPDDLFASYFVCRRLLGDLLSEAKSAQEQEAIREMGRTLLWYLENPLIGVSAGSSQTTTTTTTTKTAASGQKSQSSTTGTKRPFQVYADESKKPGRSVEATEVALLWARLNVMLALERGGTHIVLLEGSRASNDVISSTKPKRKHSQRTSTAALDFSLEAPVLTRALIHERGDVREVSWALASTRIKRTKFPEPLLLREVGTAIEFVLKHEGLSLKPSILRLIDRIAFCLETQIGGDDGEEIAKVESKSFITRCAEAVGRCIYPGAPIDRIALALDVAVHLVETLKHRPASRELIRPLLLPGTVMSVLQTLESPFDLARTQAFAFLRSVPGPLPGLETREELEKLIQGTWYPKLFSKMRRDADSAALFFRLVHVKYCLELGWKVDLPLPVDVPRSEQTKTLGDLLDREVMDAGDAYFMRLALEQARKCVTTATAYDVGCVIVSESSKSILSTGYSREMPGNTHAEECALRKLGVDSESSQAQGQDVSDVEDVALGNANGSTLYTTMEPCSLRLSGNRPCSSRCIAAKVKRVVVGVKEPDKFVQNCQGWTQLEQEGIIVHSVRDAEVLGECATLANNNDHTVPVRFQESLVQSLDRFSQKKDLSRNLVALYLCQQFLDLVEYLNSTAEANGEETAAHGSLMTLRYALWDLPSGGDEEHQQKQAGYFQRLLHVLKQSLFIGVSTLIRLEETERLNPHQVATEDEDFITKTVSWLMVREGSELLSETLDTISKAMTSSNGDMEQSIQNHCGWFLTTSLSLRHLGAMTYVTKGMEKMCKLLLQSDSVVLQRIPQQVFLQDLFSKLGKEEHDRALRRTEGFSLSFRAILRAAQVSNRTDLIQITLKQLLNIASTFVTLPKHQIAALNVLCMLFEDSMLSRAVMPYISTALELAVNGFRHQQWGIRNSSLNVFVALIKRAVGEPDQAMGGDEDARETSASESTTRTKSHSTTAKLFFKTHPRLLPFLLGELKIATATAAGHQGGEHPSLHPVLLFLSSLRRSSLVKDDPALDFVPFVERVALEHPVYFIRSTAVRALTVLTPKERAPFAKYCSILKAGDTVSTNSRHGALLIIQQWARTAGGFDGLKGYHEKDLLELKSVLETQYVANSNACYLLREVALDCFSRLFPSSEVYALVRQVWETQGITQRPDDEADGAEVGRSRFLVKLIRLVMRHAASTQDWKVVVNLLTKERLSPHIHLALEEFALYLGKSGYSLVTGEQVVEQLAVAQALLQPLEATSLPKRNQLGYHLSAMLALIQLPRPSSLSILSVKDAACIQRISRASDVSFKARAVCLQIMGLILLDPALAVEETLFEQFVENLEEDSQPDAPLELRLASAQALLNGCLAMTNHNSLVLRLWIRAIYLMQDDDREVCDIARRAVLASLPITGEKDCCLDFTFRLAWTAITDRFWRNPIWHQQLVEWVFSCSKDVITQTEASPSEDDCAAENHGDDEGDSLLFKTDNVNQFYEATYFTLSAGQELLRVRRLRVLSAGDAVETNIIEQEYRQLAYRVTELLRRVSAELSNLDSVTAFGAVYSTIVAVESLADGLNGECLYLLAQLKRARGSLMPLMMNQKLTDCERRLFGI